MKKILFSGLALALAFTGCAKYEPAPNMVSLKANFADENWNGKKVPQNEVCSDYNQNGGKTPKIIIQNLPTDTNTIILSFSDNNPRSKMMNGGHGVISYNIIDSSKTITIPSMKGETFDLPKNFKSIDAHRGARWGKKPGAYLPPCSGGKGNLYSVKIEAIQNFTNSDKKPILHGETNLDLGRY